MSMQENIRSGVNRRRQVDSGNVADMFTEALTIALDKFLKKLNSGQLEVDNITDLQRVYIMWKEIVEFNELKAGSGSALPEIRSKELMVLEDSGIVDPNNGTVDLAEKSPQELEAMAYELMNAINNENAGEM